MCIPAEPPATIDDKMPPSSWPSEGRIELQELKVTKIIKLVLKVNKFNAK